MSDLNRLEKEILARICEIEKQLIKIESEANGVKLTIIAASVIASLAVVLAQLT